LAILQSKPDLLDTGLAIALANEKAADACDLTQNAVQAWLVYWYVFTQQIGG